MSNLFPELLEDGAAPSITKQKPTAPSIRVIDCSPSIVQKLDYLLACSKLWPKGKIHSAHYRPDQKEIYVEFSASGIDITNIVIRPKSQGPIIEQTEHLALSYNGDKSLALNKLLNRLATRLRNITFEQFVQLVAPVTILVEEEKSLLRTNEPPDSVALAFNSPIMWRTFFEKKEMYRGACNSVKGNTVTIHHTDYECVLSAAPIGNGTVNFFNFTRTTLDPSNKNSGLSLTTDVNDLDVIKGADTKLDYVLNTIATSSLKPDIVFVNSACISKVTGDDIEASASRLARKIRIPVVDIGNQNNPQAMMFQMAKKSPDFFTQPKRDNGVNLVGLPEIEGHKELLDTLESTGVEIVSQLLPSFDLTRLKHYTAAKVQVIFDWEHHRPVLDSMLSGIDIPKIFPPPPFGLEGSRRWLQAICEYLSLEKNYEEVWSKILEQWSDHWKAMQAKASQYSLGFIVDDDSIELLSSPPKLKGVPIVLMLKEMGFQLEFIRFRAKGSVVQVAKTSQNGNQVKYFQSHDELTTLMRESPSVAFYSDMYFDRRITRLGKQIFSLSDFAIGVWGAITTFERLLLRCETPFYRRYSKYLTTRQ